MRMLVVYAAATVVMAVSSIRVPEQRIISAAFFLLGLTAHGVNTRAGVGTDWPARISGFDNRPVGNSSNGVVPADDPCADAVQCVSP
jgi:hypothetical protein